MLSYLIISKIIQSKYNITLFYIFLLFMTIVYNSLNHLVHFSLHCYNICYSRFIIVNLIMYIVRNICFVTYVRIEYLNRYNCKLSISM